MPGELGSRRRESLTLNLSVAVVSVLLTLLAAEGALRFVLASYLNPFRPDPTLEYRLKRNFDGYYPWTPVRTDDAGHRIPEGTAASTNDQGGILFVGDSVTFGFGVRAEEAFPHRVAELVDPPGGVVNAAVPGHNLDQALGILRGELERHKPDLVVYGLCLNDIAGAADPVSYETINPHVRRSRLGGWLSWSALATFVERRLDRLFADPSPSPQPADELVPLLRDFPSEERAQARIAFSSQWNTLEELQRSAAIPFVVAILPYRQQIFERPDWKAPQEYVLQLCRDGSLACLDAFDAIYAHRDQSLFNGTSSMHFTPRGHEIVAEWLSRELEDLGLVSAPSTT